MRVFETHAKNILQSFLYETSDSLMLHDTDGVLLDVNVAAAERFNSTREALIGVSVWDIFPVDIIEARRKLFDDVIRRKKSASIEDKRNGRWQKVVLYPILEDGQVTMVLAYARDTTHQKVEQSRIDTLSRALENSSSLVIITDLYGNITYVNPKFSEVTGYSPEEVIGENPRLLKSDHQPPETYDELWKTITGGDEWHGEFFNKKKDGTYYWAVAAISPIENNSGAITHFVGVQEDITAQKQLEATLTLRHTQLQKVSRDLFGVQEHVRRTLAMELHDNIGQSLTALTISQELLLADLRNLEPAIAPIILARLQGMISLSSQTLEEVRLIAQNLRPPELDVIGLKGALDALYQTTEQLTGLVIHKGAADLISLSSETNITIYRIVQEALTNIIKHAHAKEVWIHIRIHTNIHIFIQDDGQGFYVENWQKSENQGLGLAHIRERVEWMGGQFEIKTAPNEGTKLYVDLPILMDGE